MDEYQESISSLLSIKCPLDTDDVPKLVELYKHLITRLVKGGEIVHRLTGVLSPRDIEEIQRLEINEGSISSMETLLCHLEGSECPSKWKKFITALEKDGYRLVAKALNGEEINSDAYRKFRKMLQSKKMKIITQINPIDLLPHLQPESVINARDVEEITAEQTNKGPIAGTLVLLDRVWRRHEDWYRRFMTVLCENESRHVAEALDLSFVNELQLEKEAFVANSVNFKESVTVCTTEKHSDIMLDGPELNLDSLITQSLASNQNKADEYDDDEVTREKELAKAAVKVLPQRVSITDETQEKIVVRDDENKVNNETLEKVAAHNNECEENDTENTNPKQSLRSLSNITDDEKQSTSLNDEDTKLQNDIIYQRSDPNEEEKQPVDDVDDNSYDQNVVIKPLVLRNYQKELAEEALKNKNCIIVAPTGSGKTHVAMKIIQVHKGKTYFKIPKVAFLVEQNALADQQGKTIKEHLDCSVKVISGESQRLENFQELTPWLRQSDILVVTAQMLVNALDKQEIKITDFTLVVFDECHHCHAKHPYNKIMAHYLDLKLQEETDQEDLPQVIGLTASVGVGNAKSHVKAVEWVEIMMANLDAEELNTVQKFRSELARNVNIADHQVLVIPERKEDEYRKCVVELIEKSELLMKTSEVMAEVNDEKSMKPPISKGNEMYTQWLDILFRIKAKVKNEKIRRHIHICRAYLEIYNNSLIIHENARASDSLAYISKEFENLPTSRGDETENTLKLMFQEKCQTLEKFSKDTYDKNPLLEKLKEILLCTYQEDNCMRGIVFVRTRDFAEAIQFWMNQTDELRPLNARKFTGSQAAGPAGGMTKKEQIDALTLFKDGKHKVVVTTSVLEEGIDVQQCNLVIRYNYVTNVIAMVQARGRGRKEGGKFYTLASTARSIADREELNKLKEPMMNKAIETIQNSIRSDKNAFLQRIHKLQTISKNERDAAARNKDGKIVQRGQFILRCQKCSQFICMSTDLRKIQDAHHACVSSDIKDRVVAKKCKNPGYQDPSGELIMKVAKLFCNGEACGIDIGIVSIFKRVKFPILNIRSLIIEDEKERSTAVKKWKEVKFPVPPFTDDDLNQPEEIVEILE